MRPTESPTHDQTQPGWPAYTPTRHPNQDDHPNLAEPPRLQPQDPHAGHTPAQHAGHGAHKWMMLLICLPLVLLGVWSFASGAGGAALVGGLVCMGMMAVMHLGMGGMGKGHRH